MQTEQTEIETKYSEQYAENISRYMKNGLEFYIDVVVYPTLNQMWYFASTFRITDARSIATWKVRPKKVNN